MTDIEVNLEIEAEHFTEELTDEALDRERAQLTSSAGSGGCVPV